jgi:glycine cleavage system transcriptional repressor
MLAAMRRFALSAIGRDRPGIVAGVSADLLAHAVNIEDSQMSILRGHFALVLILASADDLDTDALERDLASTAARLELDALTLSEIAEAHAAVEPSCIVTVYGVDHPGIVHAVAAALAERSVNITDLQTRLVSEGAAQELYAMTLELALPEGLSHSDLERAFAGVRSDQGVEVSVRELERDVL